MNKYEVQIDNYKTDDYDWIYVYANSDEEALSNADYVLKQCQQDDNKYLGYKINFIFSVQEDYYPSIENAIMYPYLTVEDIIMANKKYFDVDWKDYIADLLLLTSEEIWSSEEKPNNGILVNYMAHTVKKLKKDKNIIINEQYALFNTGLFTEFYEPIYALQYSESIDKIEYLTSYVLGNKGITERPERANYFKQPELLLFDWHYPINIHYKHILGDVKNQKRLPKELIKSKNIATLLNGAIDTMKKRVSANYKLAIPQYYEDKIQLLLPLCLLEENKPDLALVITKENEYYQAHTCITLDMAYNNARLIAKPESNWLSL